MNTNTELSLFAAVALSILSAPAHADCPATYSSYSCAGWCSLSSPDVTCDFSGFNVWSDEPVVNFNADHVDGPFGAWGTVDGDGFCCEFTGDTTDGVLDYTGTGLKDNVYLLLLGDNMSSDVNLGGDNDVFTGSDQADLVYGGQGEDAIAGHDGDDEIYGQDADDNLQGNDGDDVIYGGDDADYIDGGADDDTLHGNGGSDEILEGTGNDDIFGGGGNDKACGEAGPDNINGGFHNDQLHGGAQSDKLKGGPHSDACEDYTAHFSCESDRPTCPI